MGPISSDAGAEVKTLLPVLIKWNSHHALLVH